MDITYGMPTQFLTTALSETDWTTVFKELSALSQTSTEEEYRKNVPHSLLEIVGEVFEKSILKVVVSGDECGNESVLVYQCIAECFRIFRNCCAGNPENQRLLADKKVVLDNTYTALQTLVQIPVSDLTDNMEMCIQTSIQFLGNFVVNNKLNQKLVWDQYSHIIEDLIKFRKSDSIKIANYSAMVLYNILLGCPEVFQELGTELHKSLIDLALRGSEFALYAVELLLKNEDYMVCIYKTIESYHRIFVLDASHSLILSEQEGTKLPVSSVTFLTQHFKLHADSILKTVGQCVDELEPAEVAKLLEVVSCASGNSPYLQELQNDVSLLIDCAYLLESIHSVGKAYDNNFTSIQRLADLTSAGDNSSLQAHPAFNFKCGLIRLLGNLCWKHRANQDKIRELDCIPLLLDCCNMDARNPLIIQWVVMAVRIICEGNLENQKIIAAMNRQGTVSSATLQEMGLTLSDDGESKICLARLER